MIEKTRIDLLEMLAKSEAFLSFSDSAKLKELSEHTIVHAAVSQDQDILQLAVIVYAFSKMIERGFTNAHKFSSRLAEAKIKLELGKDEKYRDVISSLFDNISHEDNKLGLYVDEVLNQARIKKGSRLFAHGISLGQSAHLLGITKWELMHYVGKTNLTEDMPALDVRTRLSFARSLFKKNKKLQ